jgi:hypothetical protein
MVFAIRPLTSKLAVIRQAGLGLVMGKLNSKLAASREGKRSTILGRIVQTAANSLHPPVIFGQHPKRIDWVIGIRVKIVWVRAALYM